MRFSWGLLLVPPLLLTVVMLLLTQFLFLQSSLHEDLGLGRLGAEFTLFNYLEFFRDSLYWGSLLLTLKLVIIVVVLTLAMTWPVAYVLARMTPSIAMFILAAIVASSFISIAIKVLGMVIIFSADGLLVRWLTRLGLADGSFRMLGTVPGVIIGYCHLAIGFMVMMLFSIIQTIPRRLEEAAEILGAPRWRVYWRVVVPLSLPGVVSSSLILFNLLMGAFVSAIILGGGKVLTLPVLVQRSLMMFNEYGMAAALSAVLLFVVLAINIFSVFAVTRLRVASGMVT